MNVLIYWFHGVAARLTGLVGFLWSLKSGQYDDLDGAAVASCPTMTSTVSCLSRQLDVGHANDGSSGSVAIPKPRPLHISSIMAFSGSTWPRIGFNPFGASVFDDQLHEQPAEALPLQIGADEDGVFAGS